MLTTGTTAGVKVPAAADGSRELKFTLPGGRVDMARRWLDAICRRDKAHPAALVWTIYYDTSQLESLGEKANSDYLKLKIRLRWYSEIGRAASGPAFIEAKLREGTRRDKVRVAAPCGAEELATWDLQDPRLRPLPLLLRASGVVLRDVWHPVLLIRYRRDRFIEPVSRARVSLDTEIAAAAVNRRFFSAVDQTPIGPAILEVKGGDEQLPAALRTLLQLGARKRSFSKFLTVYAHARRVIL